MRVVHTEASLLNAINVNKAEALAAFSNDQVYMEKFLERPRHIEFQVLADKPRQCHFIWGSATAPCSVATRRSHRGSASPRHH